MEKVRLGDVCEKGSSNIAQKDLEGNEGKYPIYGASGLIKYVDFYKQDKEYIAIVKDGAGVGRTMILPAYSSVIGTMQYIFPKNNIDISFLYYAITHMGLGKYFSGATIPHIYFKDYQKEKFNIYEIEEQKKIAYVLDKITELIDKRKQQLEKLDELVKSRFVEMFGDPVSNNMNWHREELDNICNGIGDGLHGTPQYDDNGTYPFINGNNLIDGRIIINSATKMVSKDVYNKYFIRIDENAILLSINGTLGRIALYNGEEVVLGKSACYCNLKKDINRIFVFGLMNSDEFSDFLDTNATKSTIKNVGLKTIREYKTILPPLDLQNKFADFVEQTDKSKLAVKQALEKLETLKKALMQKYFG